MKSFKEFEKEFVDEIGVQGGAGGNGYSWSGNSRCSSVSVPSRCGSVSVVETKPQFQDGNFQNGNWYPGTFEQSNVLAIPQDNFGLWSKIKDKPSKVEKWMIGLGIGSLIIGIVTIIIMLI